jgi:methionyl-tRNA formyltransferase
MRIIFAGSGEFGLPALRALAAGGHEIAGVFTQPDRPAGRGRKLTPTPIGQFALEKSLPLVRTDNLNGESLPLADLLVVIAFGQKISPAIAAHARLGSVNLHSSRLPKYRGAAPINWAILRGETITGNSVIRLAQKMDAGNILGQSSVPIGEMETAGELHDRLAEDGAGLLLSVLEKLAAGSVMESPQDESQASSAPKLNRESTLIDWRKSASEICRQIRGLYPWPGCRVRLLDENNAEKDSLTLVRARAVASRSVHGSESTLGQILADGTICAGDAATCGFTVEIHEVQPQGKRSMPLADYRRGHAWSSGMRLESILKGAGSSGEA